MPGFQALNVAYLIKELSRLKTKPFIYILYSPKKHLVKYKQKIEKEQATKQ